MGRLDCCARTHNGLNKAVNEDQFLIADIKRTMEVWQTGLSLEAQAVFPGHSIGKVLAVADGSGNPESASRAAAVAVERLGDFLLHRFGWGNPLDDNEQRRFCRELSEAFWFCQDTIQQEATVLANVFEPDMGSSMTFALIAWPWLYVCSVGSCACFRSRRGSLTRLSEDQTIPCTLPIRQELASDSNEAGPRITLNVVGGSDHGLAPSTYFDELAYGDSILLCSDGLLKHVPEKMLVDTLEAPLSAAKCCESLINDALCGGGSDNITVIVAKIVENTPLEPPAAAAQVMIEPQPEETPPTPQT